MNVAGHEQTGVAGLGSTLDVGRQVVAGHEIGTGRARHERSSGAAGVGGAGGEAQKSKSSMLSLL
jgi:hypothetical protein